MELMEHLDIEALAEMSRCEVAQSRWRQVKLFKGLFLSLLFALCALFLVAVAGVIWLVFFRNDTAVQAALTGLAALANGAVVALLLKNVKYVMGQEKDAFNAAQRACLDVPPAS